MQSLGQSVAKVTPLINKQQQQQRQQKRTQRKRVHEVSESEDEPEDSKDIFSIPEIDMKDDRPLSSPTRFFKLRRESCTTILATKKKSSPSGGAPKKKASPNGGRGRPKKVIKRATLKKKSYVSVISD